MPCYPGSRSDQEMPEGVRHVVTAITSAQDDAALLSNLELLKSWHFEEAADLYDWKEVLDRLDRVLCRVLEACPHLVLVGVKPESYAVRLDEELAAYRTSGPGASASLSSSAPYVQGVASASAVLRFSRLLLTHAVNKHVYTSATLVSELLGARDESLASLALEVMYLLALPVPPHLTSRTDTTLPPAPLQGDKHIGKRLLALAQGWGGKSQGLGLSACLTSSSSSLPPLGGDVHLDLVVQPTAPSPSSPSSPSVVEVRIPQAHLDPRPSLDLFLSSLLASPTLPPAKHFHLLTRIRLAKAFATAETRQQALCTRLRALTALVHAQQQHSSSSHQHTDSARITALLQAQPELVTELVDLVRVLPEQQSHAQDNTPSTHHDALLQVGLLCLHCLSALAVSRFSSRSLSILPELGVQRGQYTGLLPSLFRYAEIALTSPLPPPLPSSSSTDMDLAVGMAFVQATSTHPSPASPPSATKEERELLWLEAVMCLISAVASLQAGAAALTECGLVPALVNMMARSSSPSPSSSPQMGPLATRRQLIVAHAVTIMESVVMTCSLGLSTFREIDAAGAVIKRLHEEVSALALPSPASASSSSGPADADPMDTTPPKPVAHLLSPPPPSLKVLLHALLSLLSTAFQSAGSTHIQGATEGSHHLRTPALTQSLLSLLSSLPSLNGLLVSRAAGLVVDIISNDPSVVSYVHSSGLASVLLSLFPSSSPSPSLPPCADLLRDAPSVLASLSINAEGLEAVKAANPFPCILRTLVHPNYVLPSSRAMLGQTPDVIGQRLEDLMSTHAVLKPLVMKELLAAARLARAEGERCADQPEGDPHNGRWRFLQYTSNIGRVLAAVLNKSDRVASFLEGEGAEIIADLFHMALPPSRSFFATLSTGPNPSVATMMGHYPASSSLGSTFKCLTQHDPGRLLKRLMKILRTQLDLLAEQRLKVRAAMDPSPSTLPDSDSSMMDTDTPASSASPGGKPSILASGILQALPEGPLHLSLSHQHISDWALAENAAYFKRALLIEWLTAWLAVVIKQGAHPRSQPPRGWSALMDKDGAQVLRHLRAFHNSILKEVCWARIDSSSQHSLLASQTPPQTIVLRISREEGVNVRDGPEPNDATRVRTLELGSIVQASERRLTTLSGALVYRTDLGWLAVSDERPRVGVLREERRGAVEVIDVIPRPVSSGVEESKQSDSAASKKREEEEEQDKRSKTAPLAGLRLTGAAVLTRFQGSYRNVMMVLGRALLSSAGGRWANRTWEDGSSNAQNVEAMVDMLRSAAAYLLDDVAPLHAPDPPPPLTDADALLLADCVDLLSAMLLDEKRERSIQLNTYLLLALEREDKGRLLSRLLSAMLRLLDHGLTKAAMLEERGPPPDKDEAAKAAHEALREQVNASLSPVLLLLKRLCSRQLILESQFVAPPKPPSSPSSPPQQEPSNSEELARFLHVFLAERLLPMWQAQAGRMGRLPADVLEKLLDAMRDLLRALEDEATPLSSLGASGSLSRARAQGAAEGRGPFYAAHNLMEALARDLQGGAPLAPPVEFVPDEAVVSQMMDMGFSRPHVLQALRSTGSNRPELAMDYLLTHPPPPDPDPSAAPPAPAPPVAPIAPPTVDPSGGTEAAQEGKMEDEDEEDPEDAQPQPLSVDEDEGEEERAKAKALEEGEKARLAAEALEAAKPWGQPRLTALRDALQRALRDIAISAVEECKPPPPSPSSSPLDPSPPTHNARIPFVVSDLLLDLTLHAKPPSPLSTVASLEASTKRRAALRDELIHSLLGRVKGALLSSPVAPPLAGLLHLLVLLLQAYPLSVRRSLMTGFDPLPDVILAALSRDRGDGRALSGDGAHWGAWVSPALLLLDLLAQPMPKEMDKTPPAPSPSEKADEKPAPLSASDTEKAEDDRAHQQQQQQQQGADESAMDVDPSNADAPSAAPNANPSTTTPLNPSQAKEAKDKTLRHMVSQLSRLEPLLSLPQRESSLHIVLVLLASRRPLPDPLLTQACLQLLSNLLYAYPLVQPFVNGGGLTAILDLPQAVAFPGQATLVLAILRRVLEEPSILQQAMEAEIRATFSRAQRKDQLTVREFLNSTGPLACRDLDVFLEATSRTVEVVNLPYVRGPVMRLKAPPPAPTAEAPAPSTDAPGSAVKAPKGTPGKERRSSSIGTGTGTGAATTSPTLAGGAGGGPPKASAWALATMQQVVSLLVGKAWEAHSTMEASANPTPSAEERRVTGTFLSLLDVLELMSGLAMAFPQVAAGLQRSPLPSPSDSLPLFLLYTLLPAPRSSPPPTSKDADPRPASRIKAAQMAARLLVVLCARCGEARRRIVHELSSALCLASPQSQPFKAALTSPPQTDNPAALHLRDRALSALQSWPDLVYGLADPRASPSKHDNIPSSSALSWEVVRIMRDAKMALSLASALRRVPLHDLRAGAIVSSLLRPLEIITRKSVEDHLLKTAPPSKPTTGGSRDRTSSVGGTGAANVGTGAGAGATGMELGAYAEVVDLGVPQPPHVGDDESQQGSENSSDDDGSSDEDDDGEDDDDDGEDGEEGDHVVIEEVEVESGSEGEEEEEEEGQEGEEEGEGDDDDAHSQQDEDGEDEEVEEEDEEDEGEGLMYDDGGQMGEEDEGEEEEGGDGGGMVEEEEEDEEEEEEDHMDDAMILPPLADDLVQGMDGEDYGMGMGMERQGGMMVLESIEREVERFIRGISAGVPVGAGGRGAQGRPVFYIGRNGQPLLPVATHANRGAEEGAVRLELFPQAPATATAQLDRAPAPHPLLSLTGGAASRLRMGSFTSRPTDPRTLVAPGLMLPPPTLFQPQHNRLGMSVEWMDPPPPTWMGLGGGNRGPQGAGGQQQGGNRMNWLGNTSGAPANNRTNAAAASALGSALNDFAAALEGALSERAIDLPPPTPAQPTPAPSATAPVASEGTVPATAAATATEAQQPEQPAPPQPTVGGEEEAEPMATDNDQPEPMEVASSPSPSEQSAPPPAPSSPPSSPPAAPPQSEAPAPLPTEAQDAAPPPDDAQPPAAEGEGEGVPGSLVCPPGMDPEAFAELPEDIQAELLREYQASAPQGGAQGEGNGEDLTNISGFDPEALAALPEDIRAEVMAQEARERRMREEASARPAANPAHAQDMDNASFLASLTPDLREEILQQANDELLSTLPPNLVAEAQLLRERAALRRDRDLGMFMMSGGPNGVNGGGPLPPTVNRQGYPPARPLGGAVRGNGPPTTPPMVLQPGELRLEKDRAEPLHLSAAALRSLLKLLFLTTPLRPKHVLCRVLVNLCSDTHVRGALLPALVHLLTGHHAAARRSLARLGGGPHTQEGPQGEGEEERDEFPPATLLGFFSEQSSGRGGEVGPGGMPSNAAKATVEVLHFLCQSHTRTRYDLLTQRHDEEEASSEDSMEVEVEGEGKARGGALVERMMDLLGEPLYTTSTPRLDSLLCMLETLTATLAHYHEDEGPSSSSEAKEGEEEVQEEKKEEEGAVDMEVAPTPDAQAPPTPPVAAADSKYEVVKMAPVVVSEPRLRLLCSVLREEACSDASSQRVNKIAQFLAKVSANRLTLVQELLAVAGALGELALLELSGLRSQLSTLAASSSGKEGEPTAIPASVVTLSSKSSEVKLLRVLQTVSALLTEGSGAEKGAHLLSSLLGRLGLDKLWDELSNCLHVVAVLEGVANQDNPALALDSAAKKPSLTSSSSMAGLLARLLPVVEAFFVVNSRELALKKALDAPSPSSPSPSPVPPVADGPGASEEKASEKTDNPPSAEPDTAGKGINNPLAPPPLSPELQRVRDFVESHRLLLNALLRQNPGLLERSLAPLVTMPVCRVFLDFDNKKTYFRSQVAKLKRSKYRRPILQLRVRRPSLYHDSYAQLSIRNAEEMRGKLQISFYGEEGIDAGGLTREWYTVMAREMFNQGYALFCAAADGATYQPNPLSSINPDHLSHFKFIGRIIGKALCDEQLLDAHFTRSFYKHILGVPVTHHDMEAIDPDYYKSLCKILEYPLEVLGLDLSFSCEVEEVGVVKMYDIKPNGRNIPVTDDNKMEYIQLMTQFRMTNAIRKQIDSFLSGLHDLVPKDLISIFTPAELELLSCGMPEIDLDDLQANTEYFHYRPTDKEIMWFWNILRSFSQEHKALFLQFVTGTSRVPVEGFKALQGLHGVQRFNIHRVFGQEGKLPQGHTCFNQLDLPEYRTEDEMRHKLVMALTECSEGFQFA